MKKRKINKLNYLFIFLMLFSSCESYLDKSPQSDIEENDAFKNFISFQGFVEEMYNCITDYNKAGAWNNYLFADEVLNNSSYPFDLGNYWSMDRPFYNKSKGVNTGSDPRNKRIWALCWYGIRKANLGLSKLELLTDATQEEKNLIEGQCLFFRGWFHFELMRYWGGLPYIDKFLLPADNLKLPRLSYRETALKAAEDLEAAAALLPVNWDQTVVGQRTLGNNRQRINKIFALSFLGKDLLYAASPMMNEESTGNASFDVDLCKRAADVFGEVINVCNTTGTYQLQSWDNWTDNFWVWSPGNKVLPGGTEVIMNPTIYMPSRVKYSTVYGTLPTQFGGGYAGVEVPTNNYIKNYAMANGLPIDDPNSGYNPDDPWTGREPRFYKDIIIDGDQLVVSTAGGLDQYAQLYNGGRHRATTGGSITGYYYKRFSPIGCNPWDKKLDYFQAYVPYLRLADVYLMYAESVLQGYGSASSTSTTLNFTPEQAVNAIRSRAQLPDLTPKYTASKAVFMEEIIRERAVELAFEAHRFCDLRRWNINGEIKYREKTAIDFDRDASTGKPVNLAERTIITRVVEKKHNWLPFPVDIVNLYPEFPQNPGW
ncbi:MAG: RagB/SusD family nutrient uptake outer membrane protein [Paludibacter sp.]|nr:RagB/SusD family nutrient uptake outer membrane protein [Paludibacter sp.]